MPFLVSPAFAIDFTRSLRTFILPVMRKSRRYRALSEGQNWAEVGAKPLIDMLREEEVNNVIGAMWNLRWEDMKPAEKPAGGGSNKTASGMKAKKGGLFGLFGQGKDGDKNKAGSAQKGSTLSEADKLWDGWREAGERNGYAFPFAEDRKLLQNLMFVNAGTIGRAITELTHLYRQEFEPASMAEHGREGSLRDGFNRWATKLPANMGEFLVMRTYYKHKKVDIEYLKKFTTSHGLTAPERKRSIPYLMRFVDRLTGE
ncbi:MAG: Uncharacterized protein FD149_2113 [Rhodospirillaceae bacterium]|nr:MAG: Uncharacterized protein FD149_2113 [Rhodospirillaceae bacterium]